jgi:hypothetical protein
MGISLLWLLQIWMFLIWNNYYTLNTYVLEKVISLSIDWNQTHWFFRWADFLPTQVCTVEKSFFGSTLVRFWWECRKSSNGKMFYPFFFWEFLLTGKWDWLRRWFYYCLRRPQGYIKLWKATFLHSCKSCNLVMVYTLWFY